MNKNRRKAIEKLSEQIEAIKATIEDLKGEIESLRDEEQEYYDNMPDSLRDGDKGSAADEAISNFETAIEALEQIDSSIDEAVSALADAAQ